MFSLCARCESEQHAEKFTEYFTSLSITSQQGLQIKCRSRIFQDKSQQWWSRVSLPASEQHRLDSLGEREKFLEMTHFENAFYEHLKAASQFRYAFLGKGVNQLILRCEALGIFESLEVGDTPQIAYLKGIVLDETIYQTLNHPSSAFQPFSPGYVWISPNTELLPAIGKQQVHTVEKESKKSSEVMYQKGTTLLGRAQ